MERSRHAPFHKLTVRRQRLVEHFCGSGPRRFDNDRSMDRVGAGARRQKRIGVFAETYDRFGAGVSNGVFDQFELSIYWAGS